MKSSWKQPLSLAVYLLICTCMCLMLNELDSKHTRPGLQGAQGSLVLSEDELTRHKLHFLIDGWEFYPDVLLTPDTYASLPPDQPMTYTSAGKRSSFNGSDSGVPYGQGTYVLTLHLPEEPASYAMEIPEVFSAYHFYINSRLLTTAGDPEPASYRPALQNRMLVFQCSGDVTLMLAVRNESHFYGGLAYAPVFGAPNHINSMRSERMSMSVFIASTCLLAALLAGYLGLAMKHKNSLIYAFLCLTMSCYTGFQLLHTSAALPVFPLYAVELFSGYLMGFLIMVLENHLCRVNRHVRRVSSAVSFSFCILMLIYGLSSAHLNSFILHLMYLVTLLLKLAMSVYLIAITSRTFNPNAPNSAALQFTSVCHASFLIWGQLFTRFEPILSGWFSEWANLLSIIVIGYILWHEIVVSYSYSLSFATEHRQMERQLAMQMEYSNQLAQRSAQSRKLVHDFRQHLRVITELVGRLEQDSGTGAQAQKELRSYLEEFPSILPQGGTIPTGSFCNHACVDALLQYYTAAAMRQGIHAQLAFHIPEHTSFSDLEWCTVLGNLLENAVEACQRQTSGKRSIVISTIAEPRMFFFKIENTYDGQFKRQGARFISSKSSTIRYGIGLESVRETVTRHSGTVDIYPLEGIFRVGITLPIEEQAEPKRDFFVP